MQLRHLKSYHLPSELIDGRFPKVTSLSSSPNHYRLAAATSDRYITLYDEDGTQRDKFPTKPADKDKPGARSYSVRGLAFSPDSTRLAVAQSDCIVFVYKLGRLWSDKKTICNKYSVSSSVTAVLWPQSRQNDVVFGCADGKVKIGNSSNKSLTLYTADSYTVTLAPSPAGDAFVSGHADGAVCRYSFPSPAGQPASNALLTRAPFVPSAIAVTNSHVFVAGNSPSVLVLDSGGLQSQRFDYSKDAELKEFTSAAAHPSGQSVVLGSYSLFITFVFVQSGSRWEESSRTRVDDLYSITSMAWKADGSRLYTGSLCGAVDAFDACLKRFVFRNEYEISYTAPNAAVVRQLSTGVKLSVHSRYPVDISHLSVHRSRYVLGRTRETLIVADLQRGVQSEVSWSGGSGAGSAAAAAGGPRERFYWECESCCLVYWQGELSVIEYGVDELVGCCRTEHWSPHLLSVRCQREKGARRQLAYLLDACTIRVVQLQEPGQAGWRGGRGGEDVTVSHPHRIDWLELNSRGTRLLFRDKQRAVFVFDLERAVKSGLLSHCSYVQWVPDSDVVVAQCRRQLHVWYSVDKADDVSVSPIAGDIEAIVRVPGMTEVVVDEGARKVSIALDEPLIAFGGCLDSRDWKAAVSILEQFDSQDEDATAGRAAAAGSGGGGGGSNVTAMWQQLARLCMEEGNYLIAERCYAALGDLSKAQFLHAINQLLAQHGDPSHYQVQTLVALLKAEFKRAEAVLLQHGAVDDCIVMYKSLHKWEDALAVAESRSWAGLKTLRREYYDYLSDTKQEELAGKVKEKEGDYQAALQLYLKGGFAVKAAELILNQGLHSDSALCDRVASALLTARSYEKAGEFLFELGRHKAALDAYVKGGCFHRGVELARREFPSQVVALEEQWGDHLAGLGQHEAACAHFIQCGNTVKAMDSAVEGRQWQKATAMFEHLSKQQQPAFALRLAHYFRQQRQHSEAEKFFVLAAAPSEAVSMYAAAGLWDKAHAIAITYMSEEQVRSLYVSEAQKLEAAGKWAEAERLYVTVKETELAIAMYRKHRQHDDMLRLIAQHRPQQLQETQLHLGHQYETEGNFKQAEQLYTAAKDWKLAYNMHKDNEAWEDALRVAKAQGGAAAYKQAAYEFALSVGGEAGMKLLVKRGLGELAVDVAVERQDWSSAFSIASQSCSKDKLSEVHLAHAMALEDEGKFSRAEEEFIAARKPKEAIDMYLHQQDWEQATRVSQQHDLTAMQDIVEAQVKALSEKREWKQAEALLLQHKKPELAVRLYSERQMWDDALRVAKVSAPRLVAAVQSERLAWTAQTANADSLEFCLSQAKLCLSKGSFSAAIDHYLNVTADKCRDLLQCEQCWEKAVEIAKESCKARQGEVIATVCKRLVDAGRQETAAQLYVDNHQYAEAVDALVAAQLWDKAKAVAASHAPNLSASITRQQSSHLLTNNNLSTLAEVSPQLAIDAYANSGEWGRVYELAGKQGVEVQEKYTSLHAGSLLKQGKLWSAVKLFRERGCPLLPANFPLYKRIAHGVLAAAGEVEGSGKERHPASDQLSPHAFAVLSDLRLMLYELMKELHVIDSAGSPATAELSRALLIVHLLHLRFVCQQAELTSLSCKQAVALLRYTQLLPVDKHFHDAGVACRAASALNMAFVFFNRFVDLTDLMAEPDSGDIDNADFLLTDIPSPFDTPLPSTQFYEDGVREEVREWVLEKAMSHDVGQQLSTRACDKCGKAMYEAALTCGHCRYEFECCVVTGYPIVKGKKVGCTQCGKSANKDDWNRFVQKMRSCPWCRAAATPVF